MKTMQGRIRAAVLMGAAVSVLAFAGGAKAQDRNSNDNQWSNGDSAPSDNPWPYAATGHSPVLAVVGDVACQPSVAEPLEAANETCDDSPAPKKRTPTTAPPEPLVQAQAATATEIENMTPDAVALLGDEQYQIGQYSDFESSYDLTYGAFKSITRPAPGNHEFYDEHGAIGVLGYGYFSYFNGVQACPLPPLAPASPTCIAPVTGGEVGVETTTIEDPSVSTYFNDAPAPATTVASSGGTFTSPVPQQYGQAGQFEGTGGLGTVVVCTSGVCVPKAPSAASGVGDGWYSYNLGSWHLISLNIECENQQGGCPVSNVTTPSAGAAKLETPGPWFAAELEWLKKDLEANHSACTLAYWHQPTFSATNGITLEGFAAQYFWQLLYKYGADVVLNGHDHLYAHYQPLDPSGKPDWRRGIREFIVGTGGETLDPVVTSNTTAADPSGNPNFNADYLETPKGVTLPETATEGGQFWGVMALTLDPNGYKWDFESALADPQQTASTPSLSDKGVGFCHGSPNRDDADHDHDH